MTNSYSISFLCLKASTFQQRLLDCLSHSHSSRKEKRAKGAKKGPPSTTASPTWIISSISNSMKPSSED
ncbi:hypothetical protein CEXT_714071 [Caerostris extrusa]|uniref:Uncharacterized protein n=1 Tax=Caerostris extrusa TaxID=172846 RepID=A0AAV4N482_CAEEX|nr:hypothetical protein CEXT_714071 [Caerostris extrusa]